MAIFTDLEGSAETLRETLYEGHVVVLTRLRAVADFVDYTRDQLVELFAPYEPESAHDHFEPAEMAKMLGAWKPRFIHDDRSKRHVRHIIEEAGLSAEGTHFDVPKPRTAFPMGHLSTGVAFAFPWHRDTWYSAPRQQLNWWLPIYPVAPNNAMSFDFPSFARAVPNNSGSFDYYENNAGRFTTAKQVKSETQVRPGAYDHEPAYEAVILPAPGEILLFSGAQLHKTIPNTSGRSRFSVDFRTVDVSDLLEGRGAPTTDVECTGTAVRDFRNVADESSFDEDMVVRLFGAPPPGAMLVFSRDDAEVAASKA
jgi:hypothetical protein